MNGLQAPRGVPEYLPPVSEDFLAVRNTLGRAAQLGGYGYIELPVFEDTAVFVRGVGESTDVVSKEMYTFTDRGDRSLSLRPEGTAGVMRSVLEHGLHRGGLPVKLWYAGPFFRAERPQQGRYRQLQQVGVEAIGVDDPLLDAEVIAVADEGYRRLGLRGFRLYLSSIGCRTCRPVYRAALQEFLDGLDLDEPTRQRAQLNPLRVLDDKRPAIQDLLVDAPLPPDYLCDECREHFTRVQQALTALGVRFTLNPRLVRGLDYYTRTTFEFDHPALGAQSGIGGGGRYDGLMESLGGPELTGIGFGLGTDRTLLACQAEGLHPAAARPIEAYIVPVGEAARDAGLVLAGRLRAAGVGVDMAYGGRGMKGAMKGADRSGARWAIIMGERELAEGVVQLKDLETGAQAAVSADEVLGKILTGEIS
ncbi:MAG: histidine--tRNA ligase [Candidatus Nanopelagicales bacterium]|nr:histidine--tRNA ligase [Candidatus Nanopelagicales bacterium]MCU0298308.1 histidine--tRNA ligase [Candidatus Nanopelagicales bacterium]